MKIILLALLTLLLTVQAHQHHKLRNHHSKKAFRFLRRRDDPPAPDAAKEGDAKEGDAKEGDAKEGDAKEGNGTNETAPAGPPQLQDEMLPPNSFDVEQCNQVVTAKGTFILDLWNTTLRGPMVFVMNVYTVSIFTKETPDSLVNSIDMAFVSDIEEIEGAPGCIVISSKIENKTLIPCFATEEDKPAAIKAYEVLRKCQDGPEEENLTPCEKEEKMKQQMKKAMEAAKKEAEEAAKEGGDKKEEGGEEKKPEEGAEEKKPEEEKPARRRRKL